MNPSSVIYILIFLLNSFYGILLVINGFNEIYIYNGWEAVSFFILTSNIAIFTLFLTPEIKFKKLPNFDINIPVYIIYPTCMIFIYNAPWHLDRDGLDASLAAFSRCTWMVYVWSNIENLKSQKKRNFLLIFLTLIMASIDGSRNYTTLTILPLLFNSRIKKIHLIYILIFICLFITIIHYIRLGYSPKDAGNLEFSFKNLVWTGLIGEAYWGSYGLSQIYSIDLPTFLSETIITLTYPFIGFFYIFFNDVFSPDALTSLMVYQELKEPYFPMGGYNIHAQFFRYGWIGICLFYIYILSIRTICKIILPFSFFPFNLIIVFISIKTSPHTLMNFVYYIMFVYFILVSINYVKQLFLK